MLAESRPMSRRPAALLSAAESDGKDLLSTELGVAEREGRYGFRRARRGPSVGHALVGRVNSAECPGAQPTPTRPLPSLPHTAMYHPLADFEEFRDRFSKRHLSLFHPASLASFAQIARRRPPSALSSSAASSASSSRRARLAVFSLLCASSSSTTLHSLSERVKGGSSKERRQARGRGG